MVADPLNYVGREQALVKHYFLEAYLESLIFKTASAYDEVAYVDGFSGPWQSTGEDFEDTSFGIALAALRKAKASWKDLRGRDVKMSAFLVEKSSAAFTNLDTIRAKFPDIEIRTYNRDFMAVADTLVRDIPAQAFAFVLIDPKGWRINMQQLGGLLGRPNSEVVFNFMFDFINRAASMSLPALQDGLRELMPYGNWRAKLSGNLEPDERRAVLVEGFRDTLATIGRYKYVAEIPVLRPLKDRTLYSLFYGTRHEKGIEVFRACHLKTERHQAEVRTATKRTHEERSTGQPSLFGRDVQFGPREIEAYLEEQKLRAEQTILALTPQAPAQITYAGLWPQVLARHAVTLPDVNRISAKLRGSGDLIFHDWEPGKRVPADTYRLSRKPA